MALLLLASGFASWGSQLSWRLTASGQSLPATSSGVIALSMVSNLRRAAGSSSSSQHPALARPRLTRAGATAAASTPVGPSVAGPRSSAPAITSGPPGVLSQFAGASLAGDISQLGSDQSLEPPDTQIAAGPADLVEAVNDSLWVYSKSGSLLSARDLNTFFAAPSGFSFSDPRVAYDASNSRWYLSGLAFDSSYDSNIYLAVSETADPTGNWYVYLVSHESASLQDQPKLGFDADVLVLCWDDYSASNAFTGQETWVLNLAQALVGGSVSETKFGPAANRFDLVPAISYSATTTAWAVYNGSCGANTTGTCPLGSGAGSSIGVVALTGTPPSAVTWTESDLPIAGTLDPPAAVQPGSSVLVNTNDDRFLSDTYSGGSLWVAGNDGCLPAGDTVTRACARLIQVATATSSVALDQDLAYPGGYLYYPAAIPDSTGNVVVAATYSSSSVYPEAVALALPSLATTFEGTAFQPGGGAYTGSRWGDYSGAAPDPADPQQVWLAAEYSPASGGWATSVADVTLAAPVVSSITPASGPAGGGTSVAIAGSYFARDSTVSFGAAGASSTLLSATAIDAVSPPGSPGPVAVTVSDADGTSAQASSDQFTYVSNLVVTTTSLAAGRVGIPYSATLSAAGGTAPYHWSLSSGALPVGLSLASSGQISGTPGSPAGTAAFAVTVTDSSTSAEVATAGLTLVVNPAGAAYDPLAPTRLLDTRVTGQTLGPGGTLDLTVTGGQVPADATAVALNVTATDTTASGWLAVFPAGESRPLISNLNWVAGKTVPNLVIATVGAQGQVSFYSPAGEVDLVVDLEGYFSSVTSSGTAGSYVPLTPARITDTRPGSGEPNQGQTLGPGSNIVVQVAGTGGVPASGVEAALLNVTVTNTTAPSYLTVYPAGAQRPLASNLNWAGGLTVANRVVVPVGTGGQIDVYNASGYTDVVVDVDGYFTNGTTTPAGASLFTPATPDRLLDTRLTGRPLGPGGTLVQPISGSDGIAADATAVVANYTVTDTTAASFLTVYPGGTRPLASDVNWVAGVTAANLTVATLGGGDTFVYNAQGSTDLVIDVFGYFTPD